MIKVHFFIINLLSLLVKLHFIVALANLIVGCYQPFILHAKHFLLMITETPDFLHAKHFLLMIIHQLSPLPILIFCVFALLVLEIFLVKVEKYP